MDNFKQYLIFLIFFQTTLVNAQGFGVNAGGNFANLKSDQAQGNTNTGLNGGLRFDIPILGDEEKTPLRFSPEIFIKQAGSDEFVSSFQTVDYQNLDLTYVGLYLPITLGFGNNNDEVNYHTFAGAFLQGSFFIDYASGASRTISGLEEDLTFTTNSDRVDFGFSFNVQFLTSGYGGIKLGYNYGLNKIKFIDSSNPVFAKNNGLFLNYTTHFGN